MRGASRLIPLPCFLALLPAGAHFWRSGQPGLAAAGLAGLGRFGAFQQVGGDAAVAGSRRRGGLGRSLGGSRLGRSLVLGRLGLGQDVG